MSCLTINIINDSFRSKVRDSIFTVISNRFVEATEVGQQEAQSMVKGRGPNRYCEQRQGVKGFYAIWFLDLVT